MIHILVVIIGIILLLAILSTILNILDWISNHFIIFLLIVLAIIVSIIGAIRIPSIAIPVILTGIVFVLTTNAIIKQIHTQHSTKIHHIKAYNSPAEDIISFSTDNEHSLSKSINSLKSIKSGISNPEMLQKISVLESILSEIQSETNSHPEKKEYIKSLQDYYVPTVIALLQRYRELEKHSDVDNIKEVRNNISNSMDDIITAFKSILNGLYVYDNIEIAAEINVLKSKLQQDILSSDNSLKF